MKVLDPTWWSLHFCLLFILVPEFSSSFPNHCPHQGLPANGLSMGMGQSVPENIIKGKKWRLTKKAGEEWTPEMAVMPDLHSEGVTLPWLTGVHTWPPAFAVCVQWAQGEITKSPAGASIRLQQVLLTGPVTHPKQRTQKWKGLVVPELQHHNLPLPTTRAFLLWCSTLNSIFFNVAVFSYFLLIHTLTRKIEYTSCCKHFSISHLR